MEGGKRATPRPIRGFGQAEEGGDEVKEKTGLSRVLATVQLGRWARGGVLSERIFPKGWSKMHRYNLTSKRLTGALQRNAPRRLNAAIGRLTRWAAARAPGEGKTQAGQMDRGQKQVAWNRAILAQAAGELAR